MMSAVLFMVLNIFVVIGSCDKQDGGVAPRIPMNDGNSIPALGFGTFLGFDEHGQKPVKEGDAEIPVKLALEAGYRLIDTAQAYKTEEQIGKAVLSSSIPRENIFILTKLQTSRQREAVSALRDSLKKLQLPYVDLYLIHNPVAFKEDEKTFDIVDYLDTWKDMVEAQRLGLTKSIGISNFNISMIERILANSQVKPSVLEVEMNLNLAQPKLLEFCKAHNIVVVGYTPFGGLFEKQDTPATKVDDPVLKRIADKYKKTVPQIALRYLVQLGVVPIPKSVNKKRIEENINIFDFELSSEDMDALRKLNQNRRTIPQTFWQDHPYFPFEKVENPDPNPFLEGRQ